MKKMMLGIALLVGCFGLAGCSSGLEDSVDSTDKADIEVVTKQDTGEGKFELIPPTISVDDNELEFMPEGVDENKVTFVYVANEKVFEQKIKNLETYKINIKGIKDAHRTDYKPKVQFYQFKDDDSDKDMTMFKQERYKVEK